jgi:hypothetical protein
MFTIEKNTITMTRGDTLHAVFSAVHADGSMWSPDASDVITFYVKAKPSSDTILIEKTIPHDTMTLTLDQDDTIDLDVGKYSWGVVINMANGDIDTVIGDDDKKDKPVLILKYEYQQAEEEEEVT